MKKIILAILLVVPNLVFASGIPSFPMAFYGTVTINGAAAPIGTVVRAYYGASTTFVGQVTTREAGVYGYNNPTLTQLVVGEGTGTIRFTVTSSTINSGIETDGAIVQTHTAFVSGAAVQKDFAFMWSPPTPPPAPTPPPSGGGGGGGGGPSYNYGCMDKKALNYSWLANSDDGRCKFATSTPVVSTSTKHDSDDKGHHNGDVLGASTTAPCMDVLRNYLGYGRKNNNDDVKKLQTFLNEEMHANLPVSGYFGMMTHGWVKKFQVKYRHEILGDDDRSNGSGYVYKATMKHINNLYCKAHS